MAAWGATSRPGWLGSACVARQAGCKPIPRKLFAINQHFQWPNDLASWVCRPKQELLSPKMLPISLSRASGSMPSGVHRPRQRKHVRFRSVSDEPFDSGVVQQRATDVLRIRMISVSVFFRTHGLSAVSTQFAATHLVRCLFRRRVSADRRASTVRHKATHWRH